MPVGICGLCLQERQLQYSHLMPAAMYRRTLTPGAANPNPVLVSKRTTVYTSDQLRAHLLCRDCEQLFSRNGENYVMRMVAGQQRFPLLEMLQGANAVESGDFRGYTLQALPNLDRSKLAYFALSVFWRASIHVWRNRDGTLTTIDLGKRYNEELRRYLLGEAEVSENIALLTVVCTDALSRGSFFSPTLDKKSGYRSYSFNARGLLFILFVGGNCPDSLKNICCIRSPRQWIFARSCEDKIIDAFWHLVRDQRNPLLGVGG